MKMRTKILTVALFAGILLSSIESTEFEMRAFAVATPSQAMLDYTLDVIARHAPASKDEKQFFRLAKNEKP